MQVSLKQSSINHILMEVIMICSCGNCFSDVFTNCLVILEDAVSSVISGLKSKRGIEGGEITTQTPTSLVAHVPHSLLEL